MSEPKIDFQTWICPKCHDDHFQSAECSPISESKMFMPSEQDHSHIANEYRERVKQIQQLEAERDDASVRAFHSDNLLVQLNEKQNKIQKLEKKNKIMRDALKFYADREFWNISEPNGSAHVIHSSDVDIETNFGGHRARQALKDAEAIK